MNTALEAPAPAGANGDLLAEPAAFATLITTDRRTVKIDQAPGGAVIVTIGRNDPAVFDRFQAAALRAAVLALPEG